MSVKRAHMVSRSYLESWANQRGVVYVWDGEAAVNGVRSLNDATVVSYAYKTVHTTPDLEANYASIEGDGKSAIRSLLAGGSLSLAGRVAMIQFLDMHLERGRYADQAKVRMPVGVGNILTGSLGMSEMGLGDRLALSSSLNRDALRISSLGVDRWPWRIAEVRSGLVTGDGAVLIWEHKKGSGVTSISFPLSPTRLLVLGDALPAVPINAFLINNCRRWLIDHVDGDLARSMTHG